MIARTVTLAIMVKDVTAARSSLDTLLTRYHGYSAQLTVSSQENAPRTLQGSLRIPAPALMAALGDLKTLGRVQNESQSGEEVTQQHTDLVARLQNSRETEVQLRGILQQRTGKVSDVLEVEQEIERVRGEIETMEAEQKALEHRVDFATIDIQLSEEYKAQLNAPADSASTRLHNAFVAGYRNATETLLGFLLFFEEFGPAILIWLTILAMPVFFTWRRYRKIHSRT
jgi:chromosome segregation ATPase